MTNEQIQAIHDLRPRGKTYRQIAEYTGLSENTVKSYCKRMGLSKRFCKNCAKPLISEAKRKPKKYCNDRCRSIWWLKNNEQLSKNAVYYFTCTNCGRPFESYGNKNRKYCSRGCYISHRYGVP